MKIIPNSFTVSKLKLLVIIYRFLILTLVKISFQAFALGRKFRIRLRFAVPATLAVVRFRPVIECLC